MSEELNLPQEELQQLEVPAEELTPEMPAQTPVEAAAPAEEQPEIVESEETPAEESPAEEIPAETAPEQTAEETPAEPMPAEEAPTAEATEETALVPAEDTPAEAQPEEIPAEEVPAGEVPAEAIPTEEATEAAPAEEASVEEAAQGPKPYHERYYLRYKEGKRTTALDLDGTKAFLQGLGFDGGELRQARHGKDTAASLRDAEAEKSQMFCSYCGTGIAGVDFYRLPDGRLRCTHCSSTLVQSKAEVEELYRRVVNNLDSFFGATIDVPVSVEIVDERKLKKKMGMPLGTQDERSTLVLGVAIYKKKDYRIILENGAPRISLIATFAHELTHIWQYAHWDNKKGFKKCPKSKRLLVYEGMAKWVEIQYLYLIGETDAAKREEARTLARDDEYGNGFRLFEDRFPLSRETMCCGDTPFTPDRYPFDDDNGDEKEEAAPQEPEAPQDPQEPEKAEKPEKAKKPWFGGLFPKKPKADKKPQAPAEEEPQAPEEEAEEEPAEDAEEE